MLTFIPFLPLILSILFILSNSYGSCAKDSLSHASLLGSNPSSPRVEWSAICPTPSPAAEVDNEAPSSRADDGGLALLTRYFPDQLRDRVTRKPLPQFGDQLQTR